MNIAQPKSIREDKIPRTVHIWDIEGFVKLSDKNREKFRGLIRTYGVKKLARDLNFDEETIYSIYSNGRKKGAHSIKHLLKITTFLDYDLNDLEKEITFYGRTQANMYKFSFPFNLTPLHIRAVSIHGDGSFNKLTTQCTWYQKHQNIAHMEKLLQVIFQDTTIAFYKKNDVISSITIPSALVYLTCKSFNMQLKEFCSIKFFEKICKTPEEFQFQVFSQFIIDEGCLKGTTLTVSQKKKWSRDGFKILLDSLRFDYSKPINDKQDITIYNYNFPRILDHLNRAKKKFGNVAGLWFKEREFVEACKKVNPSHYPLIRESMNINRVIFKKLNMAKSIFNYQDIKNFGRTHSQAQKAIRCWKKNNLIKRISWNKYEIL